MYKAVLQKNITIKLFQRLYFQKFPEMSRDMIFILFWIFLR